MRRGTAGLAAIWIVAVVVSAPRLAPRAAEGAAAAQGPVVVVVFDELPLSTLQDASGEIDPVWYPSFAELSRQSTWVTGASSVATRILDAVPAILTGRRPGLQRLDAVHANHPENLFSLLEPTHHLNVVETHTLVRAEPDPRPVGADGRRVGPDPQLARLAEIRRDNNRRYDEVEVFRRFIRSIRSHHELARPGRGSLHFIHIMLPTAPWRFTAGGRVYSPSRLYGSFGQSWSEEPWWPEEAYRRHILQTRFTDALLGELFAALRRHGLYDPALLVVTASFGTGFWPGESRLVADETEHPEDLLCVPLFIKRPHQKSAARAGGVVETIDILPTIADLLGLEVGWEVDGCSIFAEACPERAQRTSLSYDRRSGRRRIVRFDPGIVQRRTTLERRLEHIGSGAHPQRMYRFGPHAGLAGRRVEELDVKSEVAGSMAAKRGARKQKKTKRRPVGTGGVRFVRTLKLDREPVQVPQVALAVDGQIVMIVPAPLDRRKRRIVAATLPDGSLSETSTEVRAYLVEGESGSPTLARIEGR